VILITCLDICHSLHVTAAPQASSAAPEDIQPTITATSFPESSDTSLNSIVGSTEAAVDAITSAKVQQSSVIQPSLTVLPSIATSRYGEGSIATSPVSTVAETVATQLQNPASASSTTLSTVAFDTHDTQEGPNLAKSNGPATESNSMGRMLDGRREEGNMLEQTTKRPPITDPHNGKEADTDMSESLTASKVINGMFNHGPAQGFYFFTILTVFSFF